MDAVGNKKMLNMLILNVLKDYSDADHRLTQQEIMRILMADYETECDRRSVKNNVLYLKELGYDINMDDGYYLAKRDFENDEIQFLIDCIAVANVKKFSKRKTKVLLEKLVRQGNKYFEPKDPCDTDEEEVAEPEAEVKVTEVTIEQKIELAEPEAEPEIEIEIAGEVKDEEAKEEPKISITAAEPVVEEEKINVRFLAPRKFEADMQTQFADSYKLMADRKGSIEFIASGTEEQMFSWAMIHPEVEVLAPENLRERVSMLLEVMNDKYNHKVSSFFKKNIW